MHVVRLCFWQRKCLCCSCSQGAPTANKERERWICFPLNKGSSLLQENNWCFMPCDPFCVLIKNTPRSDFFMKFYIMICLDLRNPFGFSEHNTELLLISLSSLMLSHVSFLCFVYVECTTVLMLVRINEIKLHHQMSCSI